MKHVIQIIPITKPGVMTFRAESYLDKKAPKVSDIKISKYGWYQYPGIPKEDLFCLDKCDVLDRYIILIPEFSRNKYITISQHIPLQGSAHEIITNLYVHEDLTLLDVDVDFMNENDIRIRLHEENVGAGLIHKGVADNIQKILIDKNKKVYIGEDPAMIYNIQSNQRNLDELESITFKVSKV